jgi:CNT family concentrative nucleoside transporter
MYKLLSIIGIFVFLGVAYLFSKNRKAINYRIVIVGMLLQFLIGLLLLKSRATLYFFEAANNIFAKTIAFSGKGADFVFGPLANYGKLGELFNGNGFVFAISIICTIIFIGSVTALLYHWGIMQFIIGVMGKFMQKTMKVSGAESFACAANVFVGMTEAPLAIKPYLSKLTHSEMMAMLTGGLATVSGTVLAVYVGVGIDAGHLLTASLMSAPAALVIAKIMIPETNLAAVQREVKLSREKVDANFIDAICRGASEGFKLGLNVVAMLVAIIAVVALFNYILVSAGNFIGIDNLTIQKIFGYVFSPLAFFMGIPLNELLKVGELLGEKVVLNEFIAYINLVKMKAELSPRTSIIVTYALCGFANFGSIAIQIGGISTLVPERRKELAKLSLYSLIGGTLACFITATVAGILIN